MGILVLVRLLLCCAVPCCAVLCYAVLCCAMLFCAVLCRAVLCCAVQAVSKVRKFLLDRFLGLRKSSTNTNIKQDLVIKFRYLYEFLRGQKTNDLDIAQEIRVTYVQVMAEV